jgi:serine/threonine-protein kinase ATR
MKVLKTLIKELDSRKMVLQTSTPIIDVSLSVRRVMLLQLEKKLTKIFKNNEFGQIKKFIDEEVGKTWIESVKITCKQKMFAQAHAFIMEADVYKPQELFIEKAKYYWMRDEKASALRILQLNCTELEDYCKSNAKAADYNEKRSLLSRGRLNIARFNAEVKNVDFDTNKKLYKDALLEDSFDVQYTHNEEIYVLLADYMDRHYFSKCKHSNDLPAYDKLLEIMEAYGSSMKYGINYVLQSMPRFLQIWFDAMTSLERKSTNSKTKSREDEEIEININNYVKSIVKVLKPYYFYTAFSQLISRLCHPSYNVYIVLKMIITKLIDEYPLESMWFIMPNATSKSEFRKKRANEILNSFSKERVRFANFNGVMEKIMCLAQRAKVDADFMTSFCASMEKLFKNVKILMPLQKHLQCVHAPSDNSFVSANNQVLICKIDKSVEIMRSLQQPKKITFYGSDGKQYPMLLKFKDDLRIDFRFMEFLKVINDYFNKDADASQRCLNVRTYSVIPWSEDMGIIGEYMLTICSIKY